MRGADSSLGLRRRRNHTFLGSGQGGVSALSVAAVRYVVALEKALTPFVPVLNHFLDGISWPLDNFPCRDAVHHCLVQPPDNPRYKRHFGARRSRVTPWSSLEVPPANLHTVSCPLSLYADNSRYTFILHICRGKSKDYFIRGVKSKTTCAEILKHWKQMQAFLGNLNRNG